MNKQMLKSLTVALAFTLASACAAKAATTVPAKAWFADNSATYFSTIGSDGLGYYWSGEPYLTESGVPVYGSSGVSGSSFAMRTVKYTGTSDTNKRKVTLDFKYAVTGSEPTQPSITDPDGTGELLFVGAGSQVNVIPDLQLIAANLFGSNALTKGTSVLIVFSLQTEFTGNRDFQLEFETAVSVVVVDAKTRLLVAGSTAVAHLYEMIGNRKVSVGRFYMPFKLTVTKD